MPQKQNPGGTKASVGNKSLTGDKKNFWKNLKGKASGAMDWLGDNVLSPGLGLVAGGADYLTARVGGAFTLPALVSDGLLSMMGKEPGAVDMVNDAAVGFSEFVSDKLSGLATDKEAYYNSKLAANVVGQAALTAESAMTAAGSLATLTGGTSIAMMVSSTGVLIPAGVAVEGGTLAVSGALAADAAWAGASANVMNSMIDNQKGKTFRGGSKSQRDKWYGLNDKNFQKWWERVGKKEWGGSDIQDANMAREVYDYWVEIGKPNANGGKWR